LSNPVYRFLEFEVVTARREILRDDESLSVEPKVYDLLVYLLERNDRAVSKEELQDAVWPNVIVTESALTRCVMKARQAVGDDSKNMRVIGTVKKGGYRFVAPVETFEQNKSALAHRSGGREQISIAVLPFANLGESSDQDYMVDGLTLDISTDLSRNAWLFVVSPGSLRNHRSHNVEYRKVAEDFGVQYVVEGSLRSAGDKLRINASLVDATTGATEWSERYDQPVADFFAIQDEITQQIVTSLGSQVRRAEGRKSVKADNEALDVWGLLHKGVATSWSRFNKQSNLQAEALYREALEIEPENGRALSFLATNLAMKISNGWSENIAADSYAAWTMGKKGVDLLPNDPMVLASYGHLHTCLGEAANAVEVLQRSLELDPNSAWAMGLHALALTCCNRTDDAIAQVTSALRLSPRDEATHWYLTMLAWAYLQQAHYDDAAREAQRSINAFSGWAPPWATLAISRAGLGQMDDAREALQQCIQLDEDATRDGYQKWFEYVVRDEAGRENISRWLRELWPKN
jgi:TolB-like protein/Flp pilus assembly protein TadD